MLRIAGQTAGNFLWTLMCLRLKNSKLFFKIFFSNFFHQQRRALQLVSTYK